MAIYSLTGTIPASVGSAYCGSASKNGLFFALGDNGGGGYGARVMAAAIDSNSWSERAVNRSGGAGQGFGQNLLGTAISNDGLHLVEIPYNTPVNPRVLKWNGSSYEYLTDLSGTFQNYQTAADFNPDQNLLIVTAWYYASAQSEARIYSRVGDTFTHLLTVDLNDGTYTSVEDVKWSHNGQFFAIGGRNRIQVYEWNGVTATRVLSDASTPAWGVAWDIDDSIVFSSDRAGGVGVSGWSRSGSTFTKMNSGSPLYTGVLIASSPFAFETDGEEYLLIIGHTSPMLKALTQSSGYKTAIDATTLGFSAYAGSWVYWKLGGGRDATGLQRIFAITDATPALQGWAVEPTNTGLAIYAEHSGFRPNQAANAKFLYDVTGTNTGIRPQSVAVLVKDVIYSTSVFSIFYHQIVLSAGGETIEQHTPDPYIYGILRAKLPTSAAEVLVGLYAKSNAAGFLPKSDGLVRVTLAALGDQLGYLPVGDGEVFVRITVAGNLDGLLPQGDAQLLLSNSVHGNIEGLLPEHDGRLGKGNLVRGNLLGFLPESSGELANFNGIRAALEGFLPEGDGFLNGSMAVRSDAFGLLPTTDGMINVPTPVMGDLVGFIPTSDGFVYTLYKIDANSRGLRSQSNGEVRVIASIFGDMEGRLPVADGELRIIRQIFAETFGFLPESDGLLYDYYRVISEVNGMLPVSSGLLNPFYLINGEHEGLLPTSDGDVLVYYAIRSEVTGILPEASGLLYSNYSITGENVGFIPVGSGTLEFIDLSRHILIIID